MLHRLFLSAVSLFALSCVSHADELTDWTGFYVGGQLGGATSNDHVHDIDRLNGGARYDLGSNGVIGGGHAGYNWQFDRVVLGVEGDFGGLDLDKRKFDPNFPNGTYSGIQSGFYSDVTGRLGIALGSGLAYVKGGWAYYGGDVFIDNSRGGFQGGRATSGSLDGWTVGGGLEWMVRPNWSVKFEYQHFDFGTETPTLVTPTHGDFRYSNDVHAEAVTVGITYHFGDRSEQVPLK